MANQEAKAEATRRDILAALPSDSMYAIARFVPYEAANLARVNKAAWERFRSDALLWIAAIDMALFQVDSGRFGSLDREFIRDLIMCFVDQCSGLKKLVGVSIVAYEAQHEFAVSPDGTMLACTSSNSLNICDCTEDFPSNGASMKLVQELQYVDRLKLDDDDWNGNDGNGSFWGRLRCVAFSPSGALLACAGTGTCRHVMVFDTKSWKLVFKVRVDYENIEWNHLSFLNDSAVIGVPIHSGNVYGMDVTARSTIFTLRSNDIIPSYVNCAMAVSTATFAAGRTSGCIQLYSHSGELVNTLGDGSSHEADATKPSAKCVAFSSDGCHLVSGYDDGSVRVWDASQGTCLCVHQLNHGIVYSLSVSSSNLVALSFYSDKILIVGLFDGKPVKSVYARNSGTVRFARTSGPSPMEELLYFNYSASEDPCVYRVLM